MTLVERLRRAMQCMSLSRLTSLVLVEGVLRVGLSMFDYGRGPEVFNRMTKRRMNINGDNEAFA
jgi:hypothetical protein